MEVYEQYSNSQYSSYQMYPFSDVACNSISVKNVSDNSKTKQRGVELKKSNNTGSGSRKDHDIKTFFGGYSRINLNSLSALDNFENFVQRIIRNHRYDLIDGINGLLPRVSSQIIFREFPVRGCSIGEDALKIRSPHLTNSGHRENGCQTTHYIPRGLEYNFPNALALNNRNSYTSSNNFPLRDESQTHECRLNYKSFNHPDKSIFDGLVSFEGIQHTLTNKEEEQPLHSTPIKIEIETEFGKLGIEGQGQKISAQPFHGKDSGFGEVISIPIVKSVPIERSIPINQLKENLGGNDNVVNDYVRKLSYTSSGSIPTTFTTLSNHRLTDSFLSDDKVTKHLTNDSWNRSKGSSETTTKLSEGRFDTLMKYNVGSGLILISQPNIRGKGSQGAYEWFKDGLKLPDTEGATENLKITYTDSHSELIITHLKLKDTGHYECYEYEKDAESVSKARRPISYRMWNVTVASDPSFHEKDGIVNEKGIHLPRNKVVKEIPIIVEKEDSPLPIEPCLLRQTKRIKISFEANSQNYTIEWTHNLKKLVSDGKTTIEVRDKYTAVMIDAIDEGHFGIYTCKISNENGSNYKSTLLNEKYLSSSDERNGRITSGGESSVKPIKIEKVVSMPCVIKFKPKFVKHFVEPTVVNCENVEWIFACQGMPLHLEAKIDLVDTEGKACLNMKNTNFKSTTSQIVYELEWYRDGELLPKGEITKYFQVLNYRGILVVECKSLECRHSGTFKCRVWNEFGEDCSTFVIHCSTENFHDKDDLSVVKLKSTHEAALLKGEFKNQTDVNLVPNLKNINSGKFLKQLKAAEVPRISYISTSSVSFGEDSNQTPTTTKMMNLEKVRECDIVQNYIPPGPTNNFSSLARRKKKHESSTRDNREMFHEESYSAAEGYFDRQNVYSRSFCALSGPTRRDAPAPPIQSTPQQQQQQPYNYYHNQGTRSRGRSSGPSNRSQPYSNHTNGFHEHGGSLKRRGGHAAGNYSRSYATGAASSVEEYYSYKKEKTIDHGAQSRDHTNIMPVNTTEKYETSYRYDLPEDGYYRSAERRDGRDRSRHIRDDHSRSRHEAYDSSSFYDEESDTRRRHRSSGRSHVRMIESPLVQTVMNVAPKRHRSKARTYGAGNDRTDLEEHFHEEQIIVRPGGRKPPAPLPPTPSPPLETKKKTTTETKEEFYVSSGGTQPYYREIHPVLMEPKKQEKQETETTTTTKTTEFDELEMQRLTYDSGEEFERKFDDKEVQASLTTSVTKPKFAKPTFTSRFEDTLYYRDGDRIKLEANLLPLGDKSLKVEWLKNGEPLRLNARTSTFHENGRVGLEIYPADLSDEAVYTCQAISDNGYAAITTRLIHIPERLPIYHYDKRVHKAPETEPEGSPPTLTPGDTSIKTPRPPRQRPCFKSDLKGIDLDEGQGIHLEAKLEPLDDDNLKVDWYKDGEPLRETPKVKAGQDKGKVFLDMDDMKPRDSGIYTCKASNDFGEAIIKAPITVHPRVPKPPEPESIPVSDYWWKDKHPPRSKTPTTPAELSPIIIRKKKKIPPVPPPEEPPDLEFTKAQGRENRRYGTEVDLPPRFITDISDLQANEWDKIRFEARLEPANDKTTQIFWYHDGKILNASSRIKTLFDYGVVILEITDITTIDAGLYECIATNNFGSDSTRAILSVREDDERIIHQTGLTSQRSSVAKVKDIEETVERTIVELYPSPEVFPLPGQQFTSTQNESRESQNFYKRQEEDIFSVDRSATTIARRPIFLTELADLRAKKHETIRLEAKVEPSIREDSTLQVGWYKNGKLMFIEEAGRIRTYNTDTGLIVLEVKDTQTSDSGEYVCVVRNGFGQSLSKCKLVCRDDHYGEPPHFVNRYLRLDNLNEGDTAHVEFKLEPSDDQNMQIEWFFNGKPIMKSYRLKTVYDFGYAILDISPITPEDSGVYECKATNLYGSKTAVAVIDVKCPRNKMVQNLGYSVIEAPRILDYKGTPSQQHTFTEMSKETVETSKLFEETEKVIVHEPQPTAPRIFQPLRDCIVTQRQPASFQCTVFGYPAPSVQWFKNDVPITVTTVNPLQPPYISGTATESKDLPGHHVYTLKLTECFLEDEGMYTCQLTNVSGTIRSSAVLKVQQLRPDIEGPSFIRSLDSTRVAEGKTVTFKCTLTGKPTPVITWFKDGQTITSSAKYQLSFAGTFCKLTITDCQESDSGTYVCKAQNVAGTAECSAALLVESKKTPVVIVKTDVDTLVTTSITKFKNDIEGVNDVIDISVDEIGKVGQANQDYGGKTNNTSSSSNKQLKSDFFRVHENIESGTKTISSNILGVADTFSTTSLKTKPLTSLNSESAQGIISKAKSVEVTRLE